MQARELKVGDVFKKPGQRKWRLAALVSPLTDNPTVLVHLHDCSEIVLELDEVLETPNPGDMDSKGFVKLGRRRASEKKRLSGHFKEPIE